ncbi:MAG: T9SS type A sorting domain-containing protein [Flavobacteriales bacterium]|nr:T9SS type A sorting domain-containing protein [Flavobacteriales bacterium]
MSLLRHIFVITALFLFFGEASAQCTHNVNLFVVNDTTGANNGSVIATVFGGNNPYTYLWSTGATTQLITNVPTGYYCVSVTGGDGCVEVACDSVVNTVCVDVNLNITDASSSGATDGSITANVSNGSGSYGYSWNTGATTQTISNLAVGYYCVTVLDLIDSCFTTACDSVNTSSQPCNVSIALNVTNASSGQSNGGINATPSGGQTPYTYVWTNGATTQNISGLSGNTFHCVTVTDAAACTATACDSVLTVSCNLTASLSITDETNGQGNGTINSTISGGSGQYVYLWNNGATTNNLSNLSSGYYCLTVLDIVDSCTATVCDSVQNIGCNLSASLSITDETNGQSNGAISSSVSGGSGQYAYLWNNGATTNNLTGLASGYYCLTVLDIVDSCTATVCDSVNNIVGCNLSVALNTTDETNGQSNGSISANVSGGSGNYGYLWNVGNTTQTINNLSAGYYCVTVIDFADSCTANGCDSVINVVGCNLTGTIWSLNSTGTNANGTIGIIPSLGTTPYTYIWNNGSNLATLTNQSSGYYCVTVTDAVGCTFSDCDSLSSTNDSCFTLAADAGGNNNNVIVSNGSTLIGGNPTAIGGAPPYTYTWIPALGLNNSSSPNPKVSNTNTQVYQVIVTDANGCSYLDSVEVRYNPLHISETLSGSEIKVFPNPVEGSFVTIQTKELFIENITLYNVQGQGIRNVQVNGPIETMNIDIPDDLKGIYFLRLQVKNEYLNIPLVIQ